LDSDFDSGGETNAEAEIDGGASILRVRFSFPARWRSQTSGDRRNIRVENRLVSMAY
jgi:hypothetical protein